MLSYLIPAGVVVFLAMVLGVIFTRLYKRATKEISFVRTGFGGEKVIMNGGAVVLPVLHDHTLVNMKTLKLTVFREKKESLITKDRMRIDIMAEFYVRVQPNMESISKAAQTLGIKTMDPNELKALIEGKFVDSLRSVAASMEMEQLHENRADFVQQVQNTVSEDLFKNGLELETVSLTSLDQTPAEYFDPNNAFDAEGLTALTKKTEDRKKIRNDIERDTALSIQQKDLETKKQSLSLEKEEAEAIAAQEAEIALKQATSRKEAEEANIRADESIQKAQILKERTLEQEKIAKERQIEQDRIEKEKTLTLANQAKAIEISKKTEEEAAAKALSNKAKAEEVASEEKISTARELEEANRQKELTLIKAQEKAQEQSIGKTIAAKAEKEAATDYADAAKIKATGIADAIKIEAEANETKYRVDAEGKEKLNQAENSLSKEIIELRLKQVLIENLPKIIEQVVAPMKEIDSIKIVEMNGVNAGGVSGSTEGHSGSLPDQIVNSAMRYKTQMPVLNDLMSEIGLNLNSVQGLTAPLNTITSPTQTITVSKETILPEDNSSNL